MRPDVRGACHFTSIWRAASGASAAIAQKAAEYRGHRSRCTDGKVTITDNYVTDCLQENIALYDKNGEQHYDVISAFIKVGAGQHFNWPSTIWPVC